MKHNDTPSWSVDALADELHLFSKGLVDPYKVRTRECVCLFYSKVEFYGAEWSRGSPMTDDLETKTSLCEAFEALIQKCKSDSHGSKSNIWV